MKQNVKIKVINIKAIAAVDLDKIAHITDENIVETVINSVGKAEIQSIKEILIFLIPSLVKKNILNSSQPIISIRISEDGRNVSRKVKHVMITFAILNNKNKVACLNLFKILRLVSSEEYNILDITTRLLREELWQLKNQGLIIGNVHWKFEFYFSSDWKFLIICLGFNSPTKRDFNKWSYTSLIGQEKLKCFKNENTDSIEFQLAAKAWLNYFLIPSIRNSEDSDFIKGLYRPVDVTSYMHVLVWHIWEFMEKHNKWDGGKLINSKTAIVKILEKTL
ncbi:hypothetical protein RhiirA5_414334 [Rhizophagus irregularis]|uniref:Uncharacterized protein n=1 Tax=Rhizophagus irregularis TaxID=588596 RepID=A0A2N0PUF8_9GLOM|nr:hypothetical protein RhiirA5_414334 [Rhizophagus irregularis]